MLRAEFFDSAKQKLTDIALLADRAKEITVEARNNATIETMSERANNEEENFLIRLQMYLDGLKSEIEAMGGR